MLYEDKYGVLWDENDVNRLSPSKIVDLELHQYDDYGQDLFD
jgi:hypothetical protein